MNFMKEDFETKGIEVRKNCLDIVLYVGVSYIVEAVIVKELLFPIIEE